MDETSLNLLACPDGACRGPLADEGDALTCTRCGRRYPIVNDVPVLIVEEALTPQNTAR